MKRKPLINKYRQGKFKQRIKIVLECYDGNVLSKAWYYNSNGICIKESERLNVPLDRFIGIVAALSPMCSWDDNIRQACQVIESDKPELVKVTTYGPNLVKAIKIKQGAEPLDILGGNKVRSFYDNLLDPETSNKVCIDTHILNCLHGRILTDKEKCLFFKSPRYQVIERIINNEALRYGYKGHELQAILWVTWKGLINSRSSGLEPF